MELCQSGGCLRDRKCLQVNGWAFRKAMTEAGVRTGMTCLPEGVRRRGLGPVDAAERAFDGLFAGRVCRSTVGRLVYMRRLRLLAGPPGGRIRSPNTGLRPSPVCAGWRWQRETSAILLLGALMPSNRGRVHEPVAPSPARRGRFREGPSPQVP